MRRAEANLAAQTRLKVRAEAEVVLLEEHHQAGEEELERVGQAGRLLEEVEEVVSLRRMRSLIRVAAKESRQHQGLSH